MVHKKCISPQRPRDIRNLQKYLQCNFDEVAILPKRDRRMAILLRVYPMGSQPYLPATLQLIVLDAAGNVFSEVQARRKDDLLHSKLRADTGDSFRVRVTLDETSITESFVV